MRKARTVLALLLAFAIPIRAETTTDPLWYLLSTYVLAPDTKAVQAEGEGPADTKGLAELQSDLLLLSDGFESFRDEAQVKETLVRLEPRMSPELRPFFKDRGSSLDAIYRTLAVTDYTWAQRFPEPPCSPIEARRKLLDSRDGLFQTAKGDASPWLVSLLGPRAEGKSVEQALDQASAETKLAGAEYEKRRAQIRRLTLALASDKAVGSARSKLYCSRAAAYEDLAASHSHQGGGAILASRTAVRAPAEPSVFVVVWNSRRAAATLVYTKAGPVLLTDASVVQDTDHPYLFAYSEKTKPIELKASVARRDPNLGLAVLTYSEDRARPALTLAETAPSRNELVYALGHAEVSGLWTKTSGLVTKSDPESFQTDAAVSSDFSGGPALNEAGEVAGILVLRPADTEERFWPIAVPAAVIKSWLDGSASPLPPATEAVEDAGTAAILSRTRPSALTETGLGDWNIPSLPPPPPTPRGVCVANCGGPSTPSRSYSSYSGGSSNSGNAELGQALGKLGAVLILEGIPALFRGIGKLFKRPGKPSSSSSVATHKTSPKVDPPPKPIPLKPTGIRLTADKSEAFPRDVIRLSATVLFTGDAGSKAGIAVTFTKNSDMAEFPEGSTARTDMDGVAAVSLYMRPDEADEAHEELDREIRRHNGEIVDIRTRHALPPNAKPAAKVKNIAANALDALDDESDKSDSVPASRTPEPSSPNMTEAGISVPTPSVASPPVPKLHLTAGRIDVEAAGAGFSDGFTINSMNMPASKIDDKSCARMRADAEKKCTENRDCSAAATCTENKDIRKSLVDCQKARKAVSDSCQIPEDKEKSNEITGRVKSCGSIIARYCCPEWTEALERAKEAACGRGGCSGSDSCVVLLAKLAAARSCLSLYKLQAQLCYGGVEDTGHAERTSFGIPNQIQRCLDLIRLFNDAKPHPNSCVEENGERAP